MRLDVTDGSVDSARVTLGTVLGSPIRLRVVEEAVAGKSVDLDLVATASDAFEEEELETADDVHCSAAYRRRMAKVQLRRALSDLVNGESA